MSNVILGQLCGLTSLVLVSITYLKNNKTTMLVCVLLGNLFNVFQYMLLGATTAAIVGTIATVRVLVFLIVKNNKYILAFFILVTLIAGVLTYEQPTNIFSICGGISVTISTWLKEPKKVRLYGIPGCVFWGANAVCIGAVFSVIANALSLITIFIGMYKYDRKTSAAS